mmetsp:Transcript_4295/g.6299  ORF Transcript_4295/g.6299 Transcript_4295/m.6299 type:complete len:105 (-) Transcript_4295:2-316(-)
MPCKVDSVHARARARLVLATKQQFQRFSDAGVAVCAEVPVSEEVLARLLLLLLLLLFLSVADVEKISLGLVGGGHLRGSLLDSLLVVLCAATATADGMHHHSVT